MCRVKWQSAVCIVHVIALRMHFSVQGAVFSIIMQFSVYDSTHCKIHWKLHTTQYMYTALYTTPYNAPHTTQYNAHWKVHYTVHCTVHHTVVHLLDISRGLFPIFFSLNKMVRTSWTRWLGHVTQHTLILTNTRRYGLRAFARFLQTVLTFSFLVCLVCFVLFCFVLFCKSYFYL